jgi:hypothetical protein
VTSPTVSDGSGVPRVLSALLNDSRVQDCLWVALMEWGLHIDKVALRPRTVAEGGAHPDGWVLWIGLGPGVRLEVTAEQGNERVEEVRLRIDPAAAPRLLRRAHPGRGRGRSTGLRTSGISGHDMAERP